jgi:hypothetical protein
MNTATTKGFARGEHVVFTAEALDLFPSAKGSIFEVVDSRRLNGIVEYALAPVQEPPAVNATHYAFGEDLEVFWPVFS